MKRMLISGMLLFGLVMTVQAQSESSKSPKSELSEFKIFPNPTKDKIYVNLETEVDNCYRISLIDVSGRELKSEVYTNLSGSQIVEISTHGVREGVYYVSITNKTETVNKSVYIH